MTLSDRVYVRLSPQMRQQLQEMADSGVLKVSDHVRLAIEAYLKVSPTSIPHNGVFVDTLEKRSPGNENSGP